MASHKWAGSCAASPKSLGLCYWRRVTIIASIRRIIQPIHCYVRQPYHVCNKESYLGRYGVAPLSNGRPMASSRACSVDLVSGSTLGPTRASGIGDEQPPLNAIVKVSSFTHGLKV